MRELKMVNGKAVLTEVKEKWSAEQEKFWSERQAKVRDILAKGGKLNQFSKGF